MMRALLAAVLAIATLTPVVLAALRGVSTPSNVGYVAGSHTGTRPTDYRVVAPPERECVGFATCKCILRLCRWQSVVVNGTACPRVLVAGTRAIGA
jgi:hypothetical protein